jgi:ACS family pantothenate transporter-like MFS transporter
MVLTGTTITVFSYSWANEVCADNNEERAVVVSSMNGFQYAVAAWLPIVIFPQTMAPTFRESTNLLTLHHRNKGR